MLFSFFKHDYVARRLKEDVYSGGYAAPGGHEDFVVTLNVQPLSSDELQALPEGERTIKRIKAIGVNQFNPTDEETGTQGDRLYYEEKWYECKSCQLWDHTILSHYESEFVEMSPGSEGIGPPELEVSR